MLSYNPRAVSILTLGLWFEQLWKKISRFYNKYESYGPCSFGQEDLWKLHIEKPSFYPVTYLCNQLEQFEQF